MSLIDASAASNAPFDTTDRLLPTERRFVIAFCVIWVAGVWLLGSDPRWVRLLMLGLELVAAALAWPISRQAALAGLPSLRRTDPIRWITWTATIVFVLLAVWQWAQPAWWFHPGWPVGSIEEFRDPGQWPASIAFKGAWPSGKALRAATPAWRLVDIAGAIAVAVALARGVRRPVVLKRLWEVLCVHGAVLAAAQLAHQWMGLQETLGFYSDGFHIVRGVTFPYKNQQAAAHVILLAVLLAGAAARGRWKLFAGWKGRRWFWPLALSVGALAAAASYSRAGLIGAVVLLVGAGLAGIGTWWWRLRTTPRRVLAIVVLLIVGWATGQLPGVRDSWKRMGELVDSTRERFLIVTNFRAHTQKLGVTMWLARPLTGWGAGAFVYLFDTYEDQVPELKAEMYAREPGLQRFYWLHPDGEWVELLLEHGALGVGMLLILVVMWLSALVRYRRGMGFPAGLLATAVVLTLLHGIADYVLRNAALLALVISVGVMSLRLAQMTAIQPELPEPEPSPTPKPEA